jgi:hypothetical protein
MESMQGKWERKFILCCEDFKHAALEYVRANAGPKGKPNMTAISFTKHVNEKLLPHISTAADEDQLKMIARYKRANRDGTVYYWITEQVGRHMPKKLGCLPAKYQKGIYYWGACKPDVLAEKREGGVYSEISSTRSAAATLGGI